MLRSILILAAAGSVVAWAAIAQDKPQSCGSKAAASCDKGAKSAGACQKSNVTLAAHQEKAGAGECGGTMSEACQKKLAGAAAAMPKLTYRVAEQATECPDHAKQLAAGDEAKIRYVVGSKEFTAREEADAEYSKALDGFLADVTTVKYGVGEQTLCCSKTAGELATKENKKIEYRLASFAFADEAQAGAAAKRAKEAADKVAMKMMVGESCFECPASAADAAKAAGKSVEYAVGSMRTACQKTAKLELARARAMAALEELARASAT